MKFSDLISFNPIEDVIQLVSADNNDLAREYVKSYVMSDTMADHIKATVIDQLQMDEVIDNKGVLVVGNYGTGKSHLMSVISAVANNEDNLQYVQNKKFAEAMKPIAGKFEILRMEFGGLTMPLSEIILSKIKEDFDNRGIPFDFPDFKTINDLKKLIKNIMIAFSSKYPDKGYLIVVDELLSYLSARNEREIVLDLEFLRVLGEMSSKSKLRSMYGVQEKIFDNPKFSFVSDTLQHVSDRFTQALITKEATSYVVSERILKKTSEQKALIRSHLEKFSNLYTGMSSRLDEFVELYPIHPSYIDVFNKIYLIENRHILKNISLAIKNIFNQDVPEDAPGIISFDDYWPAIKSNGLLKSEPTISRVVNASGQLEEIIDRSFPKPAYKALAKKIIYALSVHRLTTNGLEVKYGLTGENLKDDLCLHLPMPEQDADFLLGIIKTTLKDIMTTVSGQFIFFNESNEQYYIDVDKIVDYDEKIKQKASLIAEGELDRYFYHIVYSCLEWDKQQYVPGFNIYEHNINWDSHNIYREGYIFMGLPGERSTAQPERDFYIHIMPPYSSADKPAGNMDDEVYMYFKSTEDFKEMLSTYSAAKELEKMSDGNDRNAYKNKADALEKKLIKFLGENKNTCFDVEYKRKRKQLIEVLGKKYDRDSTFGDTIDLAASVCLDEHFNALYPDFPKMLTKVTKKNIQEIIRIAYDHFAGRKTQQSAAILQSFGLLDGDKIRPEGSKYASYFIEKIKALPPQGVLNYSDLFETVDMKEDYDKRFKLPNYFTGIVLLSLVYAGYVVINPKSGTNITVSELDNIAKLSPTIVYLFKYLSRPAQTSIAELKKLFDVIGLNPSLLDNPNDRDNAIEALLQKAQELCNAAVIAENKINTGFDLWGEPMVNQTVKGQMQSACTAVKNEFSNYKARFNTPAKLSNFSLSSDDIEALGKQITLINLIPEYLTFKETVHDSVSYVSTIENMELDDELKQLIEDSKAVFRKLRDDVADSEDGETEGEKVKSELEKVKSKYIDTYFEAHKKKRLDIKDTKRKGTIQESAKMSSLKKLRTIDILSGAKLSEIEKDLSDVRSCFELTDTEMKISPICQHCGFRLDEKSKNVHGLLDNIETRIDNLWQEWTKMLLDTISDPLVLEQKEYIKGDQARTIDVFLSTKELPDKVDDFFVNSIKALLKNYEPVIIETEDIIQKLEQLPPMDEAQFRAEIDKIVAAYTKGKDASTVRIVVKRKG